MRSLPPHPRIEQGYVDFVEGLDQLTPPWRVSGGALRDSSNYEIGVSSGYKTIVGYERFDGRVKPSAAQYAILDVTITGTFSDLDVITGADSGATATIVTGGVVTSGAQDYLVITKITGTFGASEDLEVSAVVEGNTDATQVVDGAATGKLNAQYNNLAADVYRSDITAVPGSGSVLGIWKLGSVWYAWRNNAGGTATDIYKSSGSGYVKVTLGFELSFTSGGTTEIEEGDLIEGLTSSASATVQRVLLESGSWGAGTAAGRLIFASQSGTFQAENLEVAGSGDIATIAGNSSQITLLPSGSYEFDTANFGGGSGTDRIYGCDGVNRGFEFDGSVLAPIATGMTTDTPTHVIAHRNHLFFAFAGSAQHSSIGDPYSFSPVTGAGELATGSDITGFVSEPGSAETPASGTSPAGNATLGVYNENRIHMLHGTSASDWNLVRYRQEIGAFAGSMQQISTTFFMGDRGITDLRTSEKYGNFQHATYSRKIQKLINTKQGLVSGSCIAREKNQYRVFFSDGSGIFVTLNRDDEVGIQGMMPVLFDDAVTCIASIDTSGTEEIMFGSDNGFVYQMEKGTSFDGEDILAFFTTHFDYGKALRWLKKYLDITMEVSGEAYSEFNFDFELNYGDANTPQPDALAVPVELTDSGRWDIGNWDTGFWDGQSLKPAMMELGGSGENISLTVQSESDYFSPLLFSGAYIHYTIRRMLRNNG